MDSEPKPDGAADVAAGEEPGDGEERDEKGEKDRHEDEGGDEAASQHDHDVPRETSRRAPSGAHRHPGHSPGKPPRVLMQHKELAVYDRGLRRAGIRNGATFSAE